MAAGGRGNWGLWIGPFVAVVVMMLWGTAFWGWLHEPLALFRDHPPGFDVIETALAEADIPTGTYSSPWSRDTSEAYQDWREAHRTGPRFMLAYVRSGVDPVAAEAIALRAGLFFVIAALATFVLAQVRLILPGYVSEVMLVFLAGAIGSLYANLSDVVWLHLPAGFALGSLLYELVLWLLLGITLATCARLPRNRYD